jgi:pyridoxamine 5'-phosphate oxidase
MTDGVALSRAVLADDPLTQFERWHAEQRARHPGEPTEMTMATADGLGRPAARLVLLKEVDERGFVFFTSYESRKARELEENPRAALLFFWRRSSGHRQVRVEGRAERLSAQRSDAYFTSRPRESRLGAWASPQSRVIADRDELVRSLAEVTRRFFGDASGDVPRPPHWGGYRVIPNRLELWQERPHRLHDRLCYRRSGGDWVLERLAP